MALPIMTLAERDARATAKRMMLLEFLASGETWTTLKIVELLLGVSRWTAQRTCKSLVRNGFCREALIRLAGTQRAVYGITAHGCAELGRFGDDAYSFEYTPSPTQFEHHEDCQLAHLLAMAAGWKVMPQRVVNIQAEAMKLKKRPDAIAITPKGARIALEIEREVKTTKRYTESLTNHLTDLRAGRYHQVHYLSPRGNQTNIRTAFERIKKVGINGEDVPFAPGHLADLRFIDLRDWLKKMGGSHG